jgi:putative addiction module killer protein
VLAIRECVTQGGRVPFRDWLATLDIVTKARIQARVLRFAMGNLGDHKMVAPGVWEARLSFGPGYRIYFGRQVRAVIILLTGGSKKTQARDIRRARAYWASYQKAGNDGEKK